MSALRLHHVRVFDDLTDEQKEAARLVVSAEIEEQMGADARHAKRILDEKRAGDDAADAMYAEHRRVCNEIAALVEGVSSPTVMSSWAEMKRALDEIGKLVVRDA
jgi:hypothetical protein